MERDSDPNTHLPPGFRFHPSDEELIVHYLRNKATSRPLPSSNIIAEVDLYKCNPWELPKKAFFGDDEWYFFTLRDRKYPNGVRPNRMAASGYWKATGTDKQILNKSKSVIIGVKKSLVFYNGHPSKSVKTDWIMHEYRLPETVHLNSQSNGSMKLDDWVLCRVQQKRSNSKGTSSVMHGSSDEMPCAYNQNTYYTNVPTTNLEMVQDFLSRDCLVLPLILSTHTSPPTVEISKTIFEDCRISTSSTPKEDCIREYSQYHLPHLNGYFNMKKRKNYEDHQLDRATEIKRHFSTGNEKKEVVPSISSTNNVQESIHQFDDSNATVYQFQLMTKYQDLSHFPL